MPYARKLLAALAIAVPLGAQDASTAAVIRELDTYVPKALADWKGAGIAVGIVKDDQLVYAKGFGVREVGKPGTVDDKTLFAIGSNTKFFTAVAAAMLADEGKLSLDDRITKHIPGFALHDPWVTREFTLRDAMSHRSGLGRRGDPLWYGTGLSRDEIVRRVRLLTPTSSFRTDYGYQNIMFITAGQVLAAASGMPWDDLIDRRILKPLGMTATNTSVGGLRGQANVAAPHVFADAKGPVPIAYRDIDNAGPAGSINSNVQDMAKWMRFILNGGTWSGATLLKPRTFQDITGPHSIPTRIVNDTMGLGRHFQLYALGIGVSDLLGVKVLQHTGGIDGMLSFVAMVPERRLGVVVLTNTSPHNSLYTALGNKILVDMLGGPKRDWSAQVLAETNVAEQAAAKRLDDRMAARVPNTQPSRPLAEYAGTYRHEMYGDVTVAVEGGALRVRYPAALDVRAAHFHYDTFNGRGESSLLAGDMTWVRFELDARGKVSGVSIEDLAEFARVKAP